MTIQKAFRAVSLMAALFRSSLASGMLGRTSLKFFFPRLSRCLFLAMSSDRVFTIGIASCNNSLGHARTKGATNELLVHGSGTDRNLDGAV
jgi:hypothetical protein